MGVGGLGLNAAVVHFTITRNLTYTAVREEAASMSALRSLLSDLESLDIALETAFDRIDSSDKGLDKNSFSEILKTDGARGGKRDVSDADCHVFFQLLDTDDDGQLESHEVRRN